MGFRPIYGIMLTMALLGVSSFGQETSKSNGIALFKEGDYAGAINSLKSSGDPAELYYLGLAYEKINKKKQAGESYGHSLKTGYQIFERKLFARLASNPTK